MKLLPGQQKVQKRFQEYYKKFLKNANSRNKIISDAN